MKVTRGFVAVQPDGQFLYITSQQTHTGHHVSISPVADIEDATVRNNPGPRDRREHGELAKHQITWVPVEVRREVILQGYGVKKET